MFVTDETSSVCVCYCRKSYSCANKEGRDEETRGEVVKVYNKGQTSAFTLESHRHELV